MRKMRKKGNKDEDIGRQKTQTLFLPKNSNFILFQKKEIIQM